MQIENIHTLNINSGNSGEHNTNFNISEKGHFRSKINMHAELRKLRPRQRNQVRAIIATQDRRAVKLLDSLRDKASAAEIYQIENVLRASGKILPELFPATPQINETHYRLKAITLPKQVELVGRLASDNLHEILHIIESLKIANLLIIEKKFEAAAKLLTRIAEAHGNSQILTRKISLIRSLSEEDKPINEIDIFLNNVGAGSNNLITSSLLNCFQDEQEILSLKRAIMSLPDRGKSNKFTRDIARITFHPFAADERDLSELIASNLQSSLIDAILIIKVNCHLTNNITSTALNEIFAAWSKDKSLIDEIASLYKKSEEHIFYKHSSAWLEDIEIIKYRTLIDHFHNSPDSNYFTINDSLIERVSSWVKDIEPIDLATQQAIITKHTHEKLRTLEVTGNITRSAIFNLLIHKSDGISPISEDALIKIMSTTTELARTINVSMIKNLAKITPSRISKIILYVLIAKKSKNEADNHKLRSLLQKEVIGENDASIVNFLTETEKKSPAVAQYIYDICTEDFIARLSHIIKESTQITETRASLHKWMGESTGEKSYLDRARTLLIDHQINRVRNELDDNRIYVHAARFSEWMNDEIIRELSTALTSMEHNNTLHSTDNHQLTHIIENCYRAFCSNPIFGIASYLGRRIRHGTFKGHLFSNVVAVATHQKYSRLLSDPTISAKWEQWLTTYESAIDNIITHKIHIESQNKRDGILKPHIKDTGKFEIAFACAKALTKDFAEHKSTNNAEQIIAEYCWRLAEVDLKNINSYLKGQKQNLIQSELLNSMKSCTQGRTQDSFRDFNRDLTRLIDEKLIAMYGWFKRPASVSPKASLSLLYKAVVEEVKESFKTFHADTHFEEQYDIELMGGAYHILYDAFYVVIYNAAKHGKPDGDIERRFEIRRPTSNSPGKSIVTISSIINDDDSESSVSARLAIHPDDDIDNAHLYEVRSGIRKLYQLERADPNFLIEEISCSERKVTISISYALDHS